MPLLPGKSEIGHNVSEMEAAGHPADQSVAAALKKADVPPKVARHSERKGVSDRTMKGSERIEQRHLKSTSVSGNPVRQDRGDHGTEV